MQLNETALESGIFFKDVDEDIGLVYIEAGELWGRWLTIEKRFNNSRHGWRWNKFDLKKDFLGCEIICFCGSLDCPLVLPYFCLE